MKLSKILIDQGKHANTYHKQLVSDMRERLKSYDEDVDEPSRRLNMLCKYCFYIKEFVGGQRIDTYYCEVCGSKQSWPSTSTPTVCEECSHDHEMCRRCMGAYSG